MYMNRIMKYKPEEVRHFKRNERFPAMHASHQLCSFAFKTQSTHIQGKTPTRH